MLRRGPGSVHRAVVECRNRKDISQHVATELRARSLTDVTEGPNSNQETAKITGVSTYLWPYNKLSLSQAQTELGCTGTNLLSSGAVRQSTFEPRVKML